MGRPPEPVHRRAVVPVGGACGAAPARPHRGGAGAEGFRVQFRGSEADAADRDGVEPEGAVRGVAGGGDVRARLPGHAEGAGEGGELQLEEDQVHCCS